MRVLFSRNFANTELRKNKTLGNEENSLTFSDVGKLC